MTTRLEIRRNLETTHSIPTLPGVVKKLSQLADNDRASVQEMARLISSDQALSGKVLRLVNSPFYGFPGRVSTVSNALILLGVNVVKGLVVSSSIFDIMEKTVIGLWEHSLGAAVAANLIAQRLKLKEAEEISTAALLHDIGKVVIKLETKDEFKRLETAIAGEGLSMLEAERRFLDADHAEIGGWLARHWHLPDKLAEPIACHHDVEKSTTYRIRTAVVHLADVLVKAGGFGFSGDEEVPFIQPAAWERLRLTDAALEELVAEVEDRLVEVKNFSLELLSGDGQPA